MLVDDKPKDNWASEVEVRKKDKESYTKILEHIKNKVPLEHIREGAEMGNDTLLMLCSRLGYTDSVRLLLSLPEIDIKVENRKGQTAIDLADNEDIKNMLRDAEKGVFMPVLRGGYQRG